MDNRHLLTLYTTPEAGGLLRPPCLLSAPDVLAPLLGWRGADNRDRDRAVRRSTRSRLPGREAGGQTNGRRRLLYLHELIRED